MRGMKLALNGGLALALAMACGAATAKDLQCDVDSDYDLNVTDKSVILTRDTGTPKAIVMRDGRLFIDNAWVNLSKADSKRIAQYETRDPRGAAAGRADRPRRRRDRLHRAGRSRHRLQQRSRATRAGWPRPGPTSTAPGRAVSAPIISTATISAKASARRRRTAAAGDRRHRRRRDARPRSAATRRASSAWTTWTRKSSAASQPRANALESRAEALCQHMQALDEIDDALDYRLPDGSRWT